MGGQDSKIKSVSKKDANFLLDVCEMILHPENEEGMQDIFNKFDKDNSGGLNKKEWREFDFNFIHFHCKILTFSQDLVDYFFMLTMITVLLPSLMKLCIWPRNLVKMILKLKQRMNLQEKDLRSLHINGSCQSTVSESN
jgi:hypothetical protein